MMRSKKAHIVIIASIVVVAIAIMVYAIITEVSSYHNVSINFNSNISQVNISKHGETHDDDSILLKTLAQSGTIRLKSGNYILTPSGDNISGESVEIIVSDDMDYTVAVAYSDEYLLKLAETEGPLAESALVEKYPKIIGQYTIDSGRLVGDGTWYITSLHQNTYLYDNYSVILAKTDGKWIVVTTPTISIPYNSYKDIPKEIINLANQRNLGGAGASLENYSSSDQFEFTDQEHFNIAIGEDRASLIYQDLKEFLFTDNEKSTAPHANIPGEGHIQNYYVGETPGLRSSNHTPVDSRPMLYVTFPLNLSDGRKYKVSVSYDNLSKPKAPVQPAQYYIAVLIEHETSSGSKPTLFINRVRDGKTYDNDIWAWLSNLGYNSSNVVIIDKPFTQISP
jgi:hypothetical protein